VTEITDTPSNRSVGQRARPEAAAAAGRTPRGPHPVLRWVPVLVMMGAIFFFSAQPYDGPDLAWWEIAARKLGHLSGYAFLTACWWWALRGLVARPVAWAAALSFLYACSDEWHQTFVDGRTGKALDVGIDTLGIALASLALARWGESLRFRSGPALRPERR
jgi:VanZ family protein